MSLGEGECGLVIDLKPVWNVIYSVLMTWLAQVPNAKNLKNDWGP